jgi:hypothetical protein
VSGNQSSSQSSLLKAAMTFSEKSLNHAFSGCDAAAAQGGQAGRQAGRQAGSGVHPVHGISYWQYRTGRRLFRQSSGVV